MLSGRGIFEGTKPPTKVGVAEYKPFGAQADYAYEQGWMPIESGKGSTTYRNNYNKAFNNVVIPNKDKHGHIAVIGNDNGQFDVVIRDNDNNIVQNIMKGQPYKEVDNYFRNSRSLIQQRVDRLQQGQEGSSILSYAKK